MIRPRTLYAKLLLLFLGFGALMTGVFVFVMRVSHESYHREFDQIVNRDLAQQYARSNLLAPDLPLTAANLATAVERLAQFNPGIAAYVLDARGEVLAAAPGAAVMRKRVDPEPIGRFLDARAVFPLPGDDPASARGREVFSAAPLSIPGSPAAYLYIVLNRRERGFGLAQLKTNYAIGEGAGVVLIAAVLAVGGSLLFLRLLTRRLGALQEDIERFRDGEIIELPAAQSSKPQDDEIERLRRLFVQLAQRIRAQIRDLQRTDEIRRELLANVSHDLATPLTALQVQLETLSLREDLPPEERRQLNAATLGQCRRLVRLVEQLLELARLDAGQVTPSPEPFQLAELAQDVAMKFTLTARRAGVELRVEPADVPPVCADIALIERVLDSLIENAVRYAAGGAVTVRLARDGQAVRAEVHDTGCGIRDSERERIFDRFYRADRSRASASGNSGLGLAIARAILTLHGRSIDFSSAPEQGTTFFFDLPMAIDGGAKHASTVAAQIGAASG